MMYPSRHHAARRVPLGMLLHFAFILCLAAGAALAAAIGDQVELNPTHQAGAPLHQVPYGTAEMTSNASPTAPSPRDQCRQTRSMAAALPARWPYWVGHVALCEKRPN